jgi:hypothetical protein
VDEAFISPVNEFGLSPLTNARRVNLRTMSARQLQRLEAKTDERHGWALARSNEEVLALEDKLEDEKNDHLLAKQAFVLRAKEQKAKDKALLTGAEVKHARLNVLLTAALQESKVFERQIRVANVQGDKAEERIEALDEAMERLTMALEGKGQALDTAEANLKEANKELRRVRMELNASCVERDLLSGKLNSAQELETKRQEKSKQKLHALRQERDDLNLVTPPPRYFFHNVICVYFILLLLLLHP